MGLFLVQLPTFWYHTRHALTFLTTFNLGLSATADAGSEYVETIIVKFQL